MNFTDVMRRLTVMAAVVTLSTGLTFVTPAMGAPKDKDKTQASGRLLTGKVIDLKDNAISGAVVYLSDSRTHAVKTYITGADGAFHFPALSLNNDYELYAQFNGKKSDSKTVSQFDTRSQVNINLRIN